MAAVFIPVAFYVWSSCFIDLNYDGNCNHSFRDRGIDIDTALCAMMLKTIMVNLKENAYK
jgi:hypothetical protein